MMKRLVIAMVVAIMVVMGVMGAALAGGYPEKAIEFVVPWRAGGGSDTMARFIVKGIKDAGATQQAFQVVNKAGGNGQIGTAYVLNKAKNPYVWMTLSSGQISVPLAGLGKIKATQLTPLAQMAGDVNLIVVKKDSPFKSIKDVIEAGQKKTLNVGGSGTGTEDHICTYLLEKHGKIKLNYASFSGGSGVMSNLLGGHVDIAWANPNECMSQYKGGLVRLLAVSTKKRLPLLSEVPTFEEQGVPLEFWQVRGVHGPPGMPAEAIEGSIKLLKAASESKVWKEEYLQGKVLTPRFIPGADYTKVIKENEDMFREALGAMGLLKE